MRTDERRRQADRAAAAGVVDALEAQRLVTGRAREEDPLVKLGRLVEAARMLWKDSYFTAAKIAATIHHARNRAEQGERQGDPLPGYLWVQERLSSNLILYRYETPEHKPDEEERLGADGGLITVTCRVCGSGAQVNGRCASPAKEADGVVHEAIATSWLRGARSNHTRHDSNGPVRGLRHMALVYWDGPLGVVAIEVRTGTDTQKVSALFQIMKKKRSEAYAPIDRARMRAWALAEDARRVVMTIRYAEGPDRGPTARPLWEELGE